MSFLLRFCLLAAQAPKEEAGAGSTLEGLMWTVLPLLILATVLSWSYWRIEKPKQRRIQEHMERVEQALERIMRALEKRDNGCSGPDEHRK